MDIGQLRVGKGYLMVTVGQQGYLKENLTELHIIVRTIGLYFTSTLTRCKHSNVFFVKCVAAFVLVRVLIWKSNMNRLLNSSFSLRSGTFT